MRAGNQGQADRWVGKGQRLEADGDLQGAVDAYQQALSLLPGDGSILGRLGAIAYRTGQLSRAESYLQRAVDQSPGHWAYHKDLGNVYKRQGRLVEAEASLQRAVLLAPENGAAHYDLGIVYQIGGQLDKARASYLAAVRLDRTKEARDVAGELTDYLMRHYNSVEGVAVIFSLDKLLVSSLAGDFMNHAQCRLELYTLLAISTQV